MIFFTIFFSTNYLSEYSINVISNCCNKLHTDVILVFQREKKLLLIKGSYTSKSYYLWHICSMPGIICIIYKNMYYANFAHEWNVV